MALNLGNGNIGKAYLGSTEIKKCYLGSTIVFDNAGGGTGPVATIIVISGGSLLSFFPPNLNTAYNQVSTTGSGSGFSANMSHSGLAVSGIFALTVAGSGYAVGDQITITQAQGFSQTNAVIEVASIS
jgi:hypothetical protein